MDSVLSDLQTMMTTLTNMSDEDYVSLGQAQIVVDAFSFFPETIAIYGLDVENGDLDRYMAMALINQSILIRLVTIA